jgi:hypothetical protein
MLLDLGFTGNKNPDYNFGSFFPGFVFVEMVMHGICRN